MAIQLQPLTLLYTKQLLFGIWKNNEHLYKNITIINDH